ncbi:hypothetical protein PCANC_17602 [Puccinia coronata f. sp. avenae]|uniref:Uncharacterized protein n=1 Tax=Puccinia coronata f. sp. avenae TaxID=200324 RepID=A0A2N5VN18_9BASI|nr:hypothetical protein PCANC_17602 [Puccinia coronata f. sp. avenae]
MQSGPTRFRVWGIGRITVSPASSHTELRNARLFRYYTAVAQSADCLTSPDSGCQFANAPSHVPSQPVRSGRTSGTFRNIGKTTSELAALRQQFDGQMVGTLG